MTNRSRFGLGLNTASIGVPWRILFFFTVVFFLMGHDLSRAKLGLSQYNQPLEYAVRLAQTGSLSRHIALALLVIYSISNFLKLPRRRHFRTRRPLALIAVTFLAWAFASIGWTADPGLTTRRVIVLLVLSIAGVVVARRFSVSQVAELTFFITAAFLVSGIVAEVYFGTFHPFQAGYRFGGTLHPNGEGIECALLILSVAVLARVGRFGKLFSTIWILIAFLCIVLTGSRTALISLIASFGIYWVATQRGRLRRSMLLGCCLIIGLTLAKVGLGSGQVIGGRDVLGRSLSNVQTFSGRTELWTNAIQYVQQHPILGYGYGGFWSPARISTISNAQGWAVPDGHSTYLDTLLDLGAVGLLLFIGVLLIGAWCAFLPRVNSEKDVLLFSRLLFSFCIIDGIFESSMAEPSLLLFVYIVVFVQLSMLRLDSPSLSAGVSRRVDLDSVQRSGYISRDKVVA